MLLDALTARGAPRRCDDGSTRCTKNDTNSLTATRCGRCTKECLANFDLLSSVPFVNENENGEKQENYKFIKEN